MQPSLPVSVMHDVVPSSTLIPVTIVILSVARAQGDVRAACRSYAYTCQQGFVGSGASVPEIARASPRAGQRGSAFVTASPQRELHD